MTYYTGLYVNRASDGSIMNVQVKDICGHSIPISEPEYRRRGVRPPIESLPDAGQATGEKARNDSTPQD